MQEQMASSEKRLNFLAGMEESRPARQVHREPRSLSDNCRQGPRESDAVKRKTTRGHRLSLSM